MQTVARSVTFEPPQREMHEVIQFAIFRFSGTANNNNVHIREKKVSQETVEHKRNFSKINVSAMFQDKVHCSLSLIKIPLENNPISIWSKLFFRFNSHRIP